MWYRKNLPRWERVLRVTLAVVAFALLGFARGSLPLFGWQGMSVLAVASMLVLTGFIGFCPACALVGRRPRVENAS